MNPADASQARCKHCGGDLGDWANPKAHTPDCPYPAEQARLAQNYQIDFGAGLTNANAQRQTVFPDVPNVQEGRSTTPLISAARAAGGPVGEWIVRKLQERGLK